MPARDGGVVFVATLDKGGVPWSGYCTFVGSAVALVVSVVVVAFLFLLLLLLLIRSVFFPAFFPPAFAWVCLPFCLFVLLFFFCLFTVLRSYLFAFLSFCFFAFLRKPAKFKITDDVINAFKVCSEIVVGHIQ